MLETSTFIVDVIDGNIDLVLFRWNVLPPGSGSHPTHVSFDAHELLAKESIVWRRHPLEVVDLI